jgi:polysaccharide export outer membrane protein
MGCKLVLPEFGVSLRKFGLVRFSVLRFTKKLAEVNMANMKMFGLAAVLSLVCAPANLWSQQNAALSPAATSTHAAAPASAASATDDRPALQQRNPRYQVQRDDVLNISFALSPELNQTVTVQPDGYINLTNAGSIYILGMTVPQVVEAVKKLYAGTLHDPIVDVDLKDFQKPFFVVTGQVTKPGQYDLRYETTAAEAIAVAGGLMPTAKTQVFIYHRVSSGWMEVKRFNLKQILDGKNVNEDPILQPGDMIFVPEKFITNFRKYVPYSLGLYSDLNPALI